MKGMKVFTPADRVGLILSHDLACAIETLAREACRYNNRRAGVPFSDIKDLTAAAAAFTIQLAIEMDHDPAKMRALEQELFEALDAQDPG